MGFDRRVRIIQSLAIGYDGALGIAFLPTQPIQLALLIVQLTKVLSLPDQSLEQHIHAAEVPRGELHAQPLSAVWQRGREE